MHDVEDAWFFMHSLFELIWRYRFLYRDLNDLLSKNRHLETQFQLVLKSKARAIRALLAGLGRAGHLDIDAREVDTLAQSMVVVLTYWLSYEYVRNPREALEPAPRAGRPDARRASHAAPAGALPRHRATPASADTQQRLCRRRSTRDGLTAHQAE